MRICTISWTCLWLLAATVAAAQDRSPDSFRGLLPANATVIETAELGLSDGRTRALVLWMRHPEHVVIPWEACSDFVYGNHWYGPTYLSLVDMTKRKLVNTVRIRSSAKVAEEKGSFAIPFFVSSDVYYVPNPDKDKAGKPTVLNLQDLTGEGTVGQFALFDYAGSCGISLSSVFGYSPKSDRAMQFPVEVIENSDTPVVRLWVDQIFASKAVRPGKWNLTWEPGHGCDCEIHDEVSFDPARQLFVDRRTIKSSSR